MLVKTYLKRFLLSSLRISLALLATALLVTISVLVSLATETGRLFWLKHGLMFVQSEQLAVVIDNPRWPTLDRLEIEYVLISQNHKPTLEISGAVLDVALSSLIQKRLHIRELNTQGVVFYRPAKKTAPTTRKDPLNITVKVPNIPPVKIQRIAMNGLQIKGYHWQLPKPSNRIYGQVPASNTSSSTSPADTDNKPKSDDQSKPEKDKPEKDKPKPETESNNITQGLGIPQNVRFKVEGSIAINWAPQWTENSAVGQNRPAIDTAQSGNLPHNETATTVPLHLALTLSEAGNPTPLLKLTGSSQKANTLSVQGVLQHRAGGWVAQLMRLPATQPVNASINLTSTHAHANAPINITLHQLTAPVFEQRIDIDGALVIDPILQHIKLSGLNVSVNDQTHRLSGSINKQQLALDLAINDLDLILLKPWVAGLASGTLNAQSELTWDWNTQHLPSGHIALKSQLGYKKTHITLNTQLQLSPSTLQVEQLKAQLGEAKLSVKGRLHTQGQPHALTFTLTHLRDKPLRAILPASITQFIPQPLSVHAQRIGGLIRGTLAKPKIITDVNILGRYQGTPFTLYGSANATTTQADIHSLTAEIENATITLNGIADWRGNATELKGRIKHLSPAMAYKHNLPLPPGIVGVVNADWQLSGPLKAPAASIDALFQGGYEHQNQVLPFKLKLAASTQIGNWQTMTIDIENLRLATFTKPLITLKGHISAHDNNVRLVVSRLPVQLLKVLDIPIGEGRAEARLRLTGSYTAPKLVGFMSYGETIAVRDSTNNRTEVPLIWHANINSKNTDLIVDSSFTLDKTSAGQIAINIPWHSYLNFALNQSGGDIPTYGSIQSNVDTSAFQLFLDTDQTVVQGELVSDITIDGTAQNPIATGELLLKNGYFRQAATGTVLSEIQVYALANAQRIDLVTAFARDGEGGTVKGSGYIDWSKPNSQQAVDLTVHTNDAHLITTPNVSGSVSGDVNIKGGMKGFDVVGKLEVRPLEINIDTSLAASIPKLKVKEVYSEEDLVKTKKSALPDVNLDINVGIEKQAYIRGRGLTAELAGNVIVNGTATKPNVAGNFKTLRGEIKLLQKPLTLNEGRARFSNESFNFNIPATYNTGDHEITLVVSGTEDEVKMDLSSVPALPQEEILSRLLFGDSIQNISPLEAISLARAINTISNGSSFDPLNTTREKLGFDSLRIGQDSADDGGGVNVGVGKYLNERVYLELERSSNPAQPWQGNLKIDVTKEVRLNSTAASTGKTSASLEWRRDY
ncbi:translocation/assembly module TamB domain-containing protein [Marinagarivorans algicola]|uniref:translocation/assembly module TamB domain-containing protein n=1 Tax=Marinagarivorans algicola TaxID=1513270 RepID=UPI0006B47041|nr:translocation/assembly module TamB domain-containing protein [Marinagarivorans algicola]